MPPTIRRDKRPTHTHLVMDALTHWPNDFASVRELAEATGSRYNQVTAALFHLRKRRAVDVVVESSGTGWWFATPEEDDRSRRHEERAPETHPRKPRRSGYRARLPKTEAPEQTQCPPRSTS